MARSTSYVRRRGRGGPRPRRRIGRGKRAGVPAFLRGGGVQLKASVNRPGDRFEVEAEGVESATTRQEIPKKPASAGTAAGQTPDVQRGVKSWLKERATGFGSWTSRQARRGLGAAKRGWRATKGAVVGASKAVYSCARATGISVYKLVTGDWHSLSDLLGLKAPSGPGFLETLTRALLHPCLRMIPGSGRLRAAVGKLRRTGRFATGARRVLASPGQILGNLQGAVGARLAKTPQIATGRARDAVTFSDPPAHHWAGIWRHLEPKLAYLAQNWQQVLKDVAWDLIWPWPGVVGDVKLVWKELAGVASHTWDLRFGAALDSLLAAWRHVNTMVGRLYGWFMIASVLIGAIIGAFFGGAGALPGAAAGLQVALGVGNVLLGSMILAELGTIGKAGYDLVFTEQSRERQEESYERISSSALVLGVTGALMGLGALGARLGKGFATRAAGLYRRAAPVARGVFEGIRSRVRLAGGWHRLVIEWVRGRWRVRLCSRCADLAQRCEIALTYLREIGEGGSDAARQIREVLREAQKLDRGLKNGRMRKEAAQESCDDLAKKLEQIDNPELQRKLTEPLPEKAPEPVVEPAAPTGESAQPSGSLERSGHASDRQAQARAGDTHRQIGDANRTAIQGRLFRDSETGNLVAVRGNKVVVMSPDGTRQITQFKNTRSNTQGRIQSGRWIPISRD